MWTDNKKPSLLVLDKWNLVVVRRLLENEKHKGDTLLQKGFAVDFLKKKTN